MLAGAEYVDGICKLKQGAIFMVDWKLQRVLAREVAEDG